MKKAKSVLSLVILFFIVGVFSATAAYGQYKITVEFSDYGQFWYAYGRVTDASGTGIETAEITVIGCGYQTVVNEILKGGFFICAVPPCSDYEFTVSVSGRRCSSASVDAADDQPDPVNLICGAERSLEDAVKSLQILGGMEMDTVPPDLSGENRIGFEEAIYSLQCIAGLRGDTVPGRTVRLVMGVGDPKNVKLWKDTDGDGIQELIDDQLTTDASGYIEIDNLSNGTYSITATSSDSSKAVRVENIKIAGRSVHLKTIPPKAVGSISGIFHLEGESDNSGIHVYLPGTSFDAHTDIDGNFTISNVAEGTYDLRAEKLNYGTQILADVSVGSGENKDISEPPPEGDGERVPFILPSEVGSLTGTVWLQNENDHTGILVTLRRDIGTTYLTTTNTAGEYSFQDVPIGTYKLILTMLGFDPSSQDITLSSGDNLHPLIPLMVNTKKGILTGSVLLDNITDHAGVLVSLAGTQYMALTDKAGAYIITEIPEGTYTVFIKAEGYGAKRVEDVQITSGVTTTLSPSTLTTAFGTKNGAIVGRAFYLGENIQSGILISIEPNPTGIPAAATDTRGGFIIKDVPAGVYTLSFANFPAYKTVIRRGIYVSPWRTTFVRPVQMIPPFGSVRARVRVECTNPYDDVYADVDVYAAYFPEGTSTTTHPSNMKGGQFLLENVKEGIVTLHVTKPNGFEHASVQYVRIVAGQTTIISTPIQLDKPPETPTGVTAVQASGTSVNVAWTPPSQPAGCEDVIGYNVYYGTSSDQIDTKANTELVTGNTFEVAGLDKGITYYFAVEAVDDDGMSSDKSPSDGSCKAVIHPIWKATVISGGYQFNMPFDIALKTDGTKGYVSSQANACLLAIDFTHPNPYVSGQINLTGTSPQPRAMSMNPLNGALYVVDYNQNKLFVLDTSSDTFGPSPIGVDGSPQNVAVSSDGSMIYVCSNATDIVTVINSSTLQVDTTISLNGDNADPYPMAIASNKLYVTGTWTGKVYVIDLDSQSANYNQVVKMIPVGGDTYDAVASGDGKYVYVSHDTQDGKVTIIDTTTDSLVDTITIKDAGETSNKNPRGMAVSGSILYVANWGDSTITMVDTDSNTKLVLNSPLLSGGNGPENIAATSDGNKLYVVHSREGSVEILGY